MNLVNKYNTQKTILIIWLSIICLLILAIICIGGITRLTNSGLSMTDWKPISRILPPITQQEWNLEFSQYKNFPEFKEINYSMNLEEFKFIFYMEFFHRSLGKLIGSFYLLGFIFFYTIKYIKKKDLFPYLSAAFLLIAQGFMGWFMVKSGLIKNPHVSHYRLASHLILATVIYSILFWQIMSLSFKKILLPTTLKIKNLKILCITSIIILTIQIIFGAFVAGLKAGLIYNCFPLMGESFIPEEIWEYFPYSINFNDPVFVQFIHRITAYILAIIVSIFCYKLTKLPSKKLTMVALYSFIALSLQILLGIITIIYSVPIITAILHQLGAILLLSLLLWCYFLLSNS